MSARPKLLVTIDTEPDDQWSLRPEVTTENVQRLPALQQIFDRHGVRPTYFVSYAVACDPSAVDILAAIHAEGKCELGAHLHGWNTPPDFEIQGKVWECHPYLYQYPQDVQRQKFETLHTKLTEAFGFAPTSHRAGKYGLDPHGVALLKQFGYRVDSSVTPMVYWYDDVQAGVTGPDFRRAPLGVYELSDNDVCLPGNSGVVEVPVSVGYTRALPAFVLNWLKMKRAEHPVVRGLGKLFGVRKRWFRPFLNVSLKDTELVGKWLLKRGTGFLNIMFHSSELIPNSQWCATEHEVEKFVERIERMVVLAVRLGCEPSSTLGEFAQARKAE